MSRLVPHKRVDQVLLDFRECVAAGDAISLSIIGDGSEQARLRRLASELSVAPRVVFHGDVSEARKFEILTEESDVFVSASPREGLSIATLEALAAGSPAIIVNRCDGYSNGATEYLRDGINGFVVSGFPGSLAGAVKKIASGEYSYSELSQNAVETAQRYTWDTVAEHLESLYFSVVEDVTSSMLKTPGR